MANEIALVSEYLTRIADTKYKRGSLTAILDTGNVRYATGLGSAKTVLVPLAKTSGLANYDKENGYKKGKYKLEWKPISLNKDRGIQLTLDSADNIDTAGEALALMLSSFMEDETIPEIDAYRFAQYATQAGSKKNVKLDDDIDAKGAIDDALTFFSDKSVPKTNCILYVKPHFYTALKKAVDKNRITTGRIVDRDIEMFDKIPVIEVPSDRFNTSIVLDDGDGFTPAGNPINFLLIEKSAVLQCIKHNPAHLIDPASNQTADGWLYNYRIYHDALAKPGKAVGIYCCYDGTVSSAPTPEPGEGA